MLFELVTQAYLAFLFITSRSKTAQILILVALQEVESVPLIPQGTPQNHFSL